MSQSVGNLRAQLDLASPGLNSQIANVGAQFSKLKSQMVTSVGQIHPALGTLASAMTGPAGLVGASFAAATGVGFAFKKLMSESEGIVSAADRIGMGTEFLERLQYAAMRSGVSFEAVTVSWAKMKQEISRATEGGGKANIFAQLGLDPASMRLQAPEESFRQLATAISQIDNPVERTRVQMELFGEAGAKLDGVFRTVAGGMGGIPVVAEESRRKLDDLEDQWIKLQQSVTVAGKETLVGMYGFIEEHVTIPGMAMIGLRTNVETLRNLRASARPDRSGPSADIEAALAEAKALEDREKAMQALRDQVAKLRMGEQEWAVRGFEGPEKDEARKLYQEAEKLTAEKQREQEAEKRIADLEKERLTTLRQLREEAERLHMGEHNWELRGLEGREREEAIELRAEIDRRNRENRPASQWMFAGAAVRGSAEAYSAVVEHENPQVKLQREGNRIAQEGFRRVETAIGSIDQAAVAAAPTN